MNREIDLTSDFHELLDENMKQCGVRKIPCKPKDLKYIRFFTYLRKTNRGKIKFDIYESEEFKREKGRYEDSLSKLFGIIRDGESWECFLSKRCSDLSYNDHLFNNWSILHFHLGSRVGSSGMVERTGDLAIAYIDYNHRNLYFLRIQDHVRQPWYDDSLFQVVYDNWPNLLDGYMLAEVSAVDEDCFAKENIKKAQNHGVLMLYRIKDKEHKYKYIMPLGMGHASSGDSNNDVSVYDNTIEGLRYFQRQLKSEQVLRIENPLIYAKLVHSPKQRRYCILKVYADKTTELVGIL